MDSEKNLNIDVAGSISDLQTAMRYFEFKIRLYKLLLQGRSLEFDGYREYTTNDDSRFIDWKASRKSNNLLVKQFIEEKDLSVVFAIDVSEQMVFGSTEKLKCEYAGEVSLALMHLILHTHDRVGLILFNDHVLEYIPPKKGNKHFFSLVDKLTDSSNYGGKSDPTAVFNFLIDDLGKNINSVFIVSDFLQLNKKQEILLKLIGSKFESLGIMIKDPLDLSLPSMNTEIVIEDPNTGQQLLIDPRVAKEQYEKITREQDAYISSIFKESGIDLVKLNTKEGFIAPLIEFLQERIKNGRYT